MARRGARLRYDIPEPDAPERLCEHPGCTEAGGFRAPRDRSNLREYRWFCLEHVRAYNAAWDYYKGMGAEEIEQHLRQDSGWQRPTWPLGRLGSMHPRLDPERLRDPFGLLGEQAQRSPQQQRRRDEPPPELRAALDVLGLGWPIDQAELRARYKELAKRYHPDANGGDRAAEDRLKDINRAYSLLRQRIAARAPAGAAAQEAPAPG
jgi:hypothetical protein